ncbi:MAG: hypothetical protein VXW65_04465 [Pseudomonadota bacterium]|nr:hypothetical protein [Pseudomonadota bacterium]
MNKLAYLGFGLLLSGCGSDSDPVTPAVSSQIKALEVFELGAESKLTKTKQYQFTYTNNRLSQVQTMQGSGESQRSGRVWCQYQGQSVGPLDSSRTTQLPVMGVSGQILGSLLGFDQRSYSLCAFDLQNAALMTETEYLDTVSKTVPLFEYTWTHTKNSTQDESGFTTKTSVDESGNLQPSSECASSACDTLLFFNNMTTRYVQLNDRMLADTVNNLLYVYEFENQKIKQVTEYRYADIDPVTASRQLDQLTQIDQQRYQYTPNRVQICSEGSQTVMYYDQQRMVERLGLSAGEDGKSCTVDDVVVWQEKFTY